MTDLKIAVIGETGQLARALKTRGLSQGHMIRSYGRQNLNLASDPKLIRDFVGGLKDADVLINAAAYTAVDAAEDNECIAHKVNASAPGIMAEICADRNIPFIHVSTDYVFSGAQSTPYSVEDVTEPLGVYGKSKLLGENAVLKAGGQISILRTSWVYDGIGSNFFTTMLKLAHGRAEIDVVSDQFGRPTYAGHLADAAFIVAKSLVAGAKDAVGVFHVSGTGAPIHWAQFARAIFEISRAHLPHIISVRDIPSDAYATRAKRPTYSVMDVIHFERTFQTKLPNWNEGLKEAFAEWEHRDENG